MLQGDFLVICFSWQKRLFHNEYRTVYMYSRLKVRYNFAVDLRYVEICNPLGGRVLLVRFGLADLRA